MECASATFPNLVVCNLQEPDKLELLCVGVAVLGSRRACYSASGFNVDICERPLHTEPRLVDKPWLILLVFGTLRRVDGTIFSTHMIVQQQFTHF